MYMNEIIKNILIGVCFRYSYIIKCFEVLICYRVVGMFRMFYGVVLK